MNSHFPVVKEKCECICSKVLKCAIFAQNLKKSKMNDLMKYRTVILKYKINHSYRLTFEYILDEKSPSFHGK